MLGPVLLALLAPGLRPRRRAADGGARSRARRAAPVAVVAALGVRSRSAGLAVVATPLAASSPGNCSATVPRTRCLPGCVTNPDLITRAPDVVRVSEIVLGSRVTSLCVPVDGRRVWGTATIRRGRRGFAGTVRGCSPSGPCVCSKNPVQPPTTTPIACVRGRGCCSGARCRGARAGRRRADAHTGDASGGSPGRSPTPATSQQSRHGSGPRSASPTWRSSWAKDAFAVRRHDRRSCAAVERWPRSITGPAPWRVAAAVTPSIALGLRDPTRLERGQGPGRSSWSDLEHLGTRHREARRGLERNLHDGAQQRLLVVGMQLADASATKARSTAAAIGGRPRRRRTRELRRIGRGDAAIIAEPGSPMR